MRGRLAAALLLGFAIGLAALHVLDPHLLGSPLSVFSVGPYGWLYRVSFLLAGAGLAIMALAGSGWARIWLALASGGATLAAAFPSAGAAITTTDRLHLAGTFLFLVAGSCTLWSAPRSRLAHGLALAATIMLVATVLLKAAHSSYTGGLQRLLIAIVLLGLLNGLRVAAYRGRVFR